MKSKMIALSRPHSQLPPFPTHFCSDRPAGRTRHARPWLWLLLILASAIAANAGDYVLVVDTSGSMNERVSGKDNRIRIAVVQNALQEYLPALPQPSRVCVIAFNSGIVSECELVLTNSATLQQALNWVSDLERLTRGDGQTHLWTTLRHALDVA